MKSLFYIIRSNLQYFAFYIFFSLYPLAFSLSYNIVLLHLKRITRSTHSSGINPRTVKVYNSTSIVDKRLNFVRYHIFIEYRYIEFAIPFSVYKCPSLIISPKFNTLKLKFCCWLWWRWSLSRSDKRAENEVLPTPGFRLQRCLLVFVNYSSYFEIIKSALFKYIYISQFFKIITLWV